MKKQSETKNQNKELLGALPAGIKGGSYLNLGLYAFAGLGMEAVYAFLLEPVLYGTAMENWNAGQTIAHWLLTCATWGIIAFALIKSARERYGFDLLEKRKPLRLWQWGLSLLFVLLAFWQSYHSWGGFKVYLEYAGKGPLLFAFQYLYYAFEAMLFLLIIIFGQKACEVWFCKEGFPYGGIICGLTWGLGHILTKDFATGIMGAALGFAFGCVFLLVNRDLKKAYLVLFFMFVL